MASTVSNGNDRLRKGNLRQRSRGVIEDQSGLPSFHCCGDELCGYRADLINFRAFHDPGMWHTVKGFLVVNPGCR